MIDKHLSDLERRVNITGAAEDYERLVLAQIRAGQERQPLFARTLLKTGYMMCFELTSLEQVHFKINSAEQQIYYRCCLNVSHCTAQEILLSERENRISQLRYVQLPNRTCRGNFVIDGRDVRDNFIFSFDELNEHIKIAFTDTATFIQRYHTVHVTSDLFTGILKEPQN